MTQFLWERFTTDGKLIVLYERSGGALSALRRGRQQAPGSAPEMWPYYSRLNPDGHLTRELRAEHTCLVTYGVHQQGSRFSAHQPTVPIGEALRRLAASERFSRQAVERHVTEFATAQQEDERGHHLLRLVNLMKASKQSIGFDYTLLFRDLTDLQNELTAPRVRRRLGAAFFSAPKTDQDPTKE